MSISFELNANKVYLPVRINGIGPYWFVLDSGSSSNAVDTETAKVLGIALKDPWEARAGGGKTVTSAVGSNISRGVGALAAGNRIVEASFVDGTI